MFDDLWQDIAFGKAAFGKISSRKTVMPFGSAWACIWFSLELELRKAIVYWPIPCSRSGFNSWIIVVYVWWENESSTVLHPPRLPDTNHVEGTSPSRHRICRAQCPEWVANLAFRVYPLGTALVANMACWTGIQRTKTVLENGLCFGNLVSINSWPMENHISVATSLA